MKQQDVKIGRTYIAKINNILVPFHVKDTRELDGKRTKFVGTNLRTNKPNALTAARLRGEMDDNEVQLFLEKKRSTETRNDQERAESRREQFVAKSGAGEHPLIRVRIIEIPSAANGNSYLVEETDQCIVGGPRRQYHLRGIGAPADGQLGDMGTIQYRNTSSYGLFFYQQNTKERG